MDMWRDPGQATIIQGHSDKQENLISNVNNEGG